MSGNVRILKISKYTYEYNQEMVFNITSCVITVEAKELIGIDHRDTLKS